MKFGVALGRLYPPHYEAVALEADRLGFESLWFPEHLVLPVEMGGSPFAEAEHPPVPPSAPVYEPFAYLSYLAGRTSQIRLGTHVYLLGLRHPFVAARAVATLDIVSGGRAEVGIGAGWLRREWDVAGLDPATRGRRLDEALDVCKRLWTDEVIEQHGEFYDFDAVMFEPKPVQKPYPPISVGGESDPALRRAARLGDGWVGMKHTLESCHEPIEKLRRWRAEYGREGTPFDMTCLARIESRDDVKRWEETGMTRLIVTPWNHGDEAVDGLRRLADQLFDRP